MIIEGAIAIKSAIINKKRIVERIYIDKNKKTKDFNYLRKLIKQENIELHEITSEAFNDFELGKSHGGIIGEVSGRRYDSLDDGDIFYLDGLQDPYNLAYVMRTLYAFGIKNVILPSYNYENMEAQLLKSSAGAYDYLNIELLNDLSIYKQRGYRFYALKRGDDAGDIFDCKFSVPALFMLGGEKRGISSSLLSLCDEFLYIPYGSDFRNSLNASCAACVVATLLFGQRK